MGVEAQHVAILLAVQALLKGGAAADITLPPPAAKLPAAAGGRLPERLLPDEQRCPSQPGSHVMSASEPVSHLSEAELLGMTGTWTPCTTTSPCPR